jgi:hypothetical protein
MPLFEFELAQDRFVRGPMRPHDPHLRNATSASQGRRHAARQKQRAKEQDLRSGMNPTQTLALLLEISNRLNFAWKAGGVAVLF